jgi:hypothetical protein
MEKSFAVEWQGCKSKWSLRVKSRIRRKAGSFQSHKSAACIMITDEPYNVGGPDSAGMSIKSMEGMSARAEINAHWRRSYAPSTWARVINTKKRSATHHLRMSSSSPRWNFRHEQQVVPIESSIESVNAQRDQLLD